MLEIKGHSSHSYVNGTNIYFVYDFKVADVAPEKEMTRYHDIKQEYDSSYPLLKKLFPCFDPQNTMNAGNIIPLQFMNEKDT